jgi:hypothetical protein
MLADLHFYMVLILFSSFSLSIFCREWGKRFMKLYAHYTSWDNPKVADRPLVIGYVSPDFFTHSVSYFVEAPLAHHDYANCKVVVYSGVVKVEIICSLFGYSGFCAHHGYQLI